MARERVPQDEVIAAFRDWSYYHGYVIDVPSQSAFEFARTLTGRSRRVGLLRHTSSASLNRCPDVQQS